MALCFAASGRVVAQDIVLPGGEMPAMDDGAMPHADYGGGSYFSQDLGTILRLRYNTESYGQNGHGNFDIGTMQVLTLEDSTVFFDGQVTMNDVQGVGYNLGVGYRRMHFPSYAHDTGRIEGISLWTDGTSTGEGGFFPQLGLSLESLGDVWDWRANGYLPLGPQNQIGEFESTGVSGFLGNSIAELTEAIMDSSYAVAEFEAARRLGSERDAWAFAGPYFLGNDDDESAGFRAGLRGYAYPDLLVQVAVSDDEIFETNATFSVVWFVGRTRTDFQPACGVADRFREPVMRNDYVVLSQSIVESGNPLTQPDGTALRIVHVNGNTTTPGDGSFERPLAEQQFDQVDNFSQPGDIILAWAESVFTSEGTATLQDNQRLLGEGNGIAHTVATAQQGTIVIPETSPGARDAARPIIMDALGDAILLANTNEVRNFTMEGGGGRGIVGTGLTGNATIRDIAANGLSDFALDLTDIATTSTITLNMFQYDGDGAAGGGISLENFDGIFTASNSTLTNGTNAGVEVLGDSDGTMTFQNTVVFTSIDGTAFFIDGDVGGVDQLGGRVLVAGAITNDTGRSVSVQNVAAGADIDFTGAITETGDGILVDGNSGGFVTFTGAIDIDIDANGLTAVAVTDNTGATVEFTGPVDIFIADGFDSDGLVATGGGTFRFSNNANSISTDTGQVVHIEGMTIASQGVVATQVNRRTAAPTSAVELRNNTGGSITLGDVTDATAGDSGTLEGGAADTVVIVNSNANLNALIVNNTAGFSGVHIEKTTATTTQTVNINDLLLNGGDRGIEVSGAAGAGALNMDINDTTIAGATDIGLHINDVDTGTSEIDNLTVNVTGAARGVVLENSAATFNFNDDPGTDLVITTESGDAFTATGGGTLTVRGTTNTIDTDDGVGLRIENYTIGAGGVAFESVDVTSGDSNGIVLRDLTGAGQVSVGNAAGAQNSGGLLTTTGDAIVLENVANVDLRHIQIVSAGGQGVNIDHNTATTMDVTIDDLNLDVAGGTGIGVVSTSSSTTNLRLTNSDLEENVDMSNTGSGAFRLLLDSNDIDVTGATDALALTFGGSTADADVTIRNGNNITAATGNAVLMTVNGTSASVELLLDNNEFTNNSAAETVDIFVDGGATLNANVVNNTFTNPGGEELAMQSDGSATQINLNILNNDPAAADLRLITTNRGAGFNFDVVDRDDADDNNPANIIFDPAPGDFESIDGPVEMPTLPP